MSILEEHLRLFEEARSHLEMAQNSLVEVLEGEFISCLEEYSLGFWVDEEDECDEKSGLWHYEPNMREWAAEPLGLLYYLNEELYQTLRLSGSDGDRLELSMETKYLPDEPPEGVTFILLEESRETQEIKRVPLDGEKVPADYPDPTTVYYGPVSERLADALLGHKLSREGVGRLPTYYYCEEYKRLMRH